MIDVKLTTENYIARFSSRYGGACMQLINTKHNYNILRSPITIKELEQDIFLYGNAILFPPNRIKEGKFTFNGKQYQLPINEPSTNCHIHGELYKKQFEIEELTSNKVIFSYHALANEYINFPHAFTVKRQYTLQTDGLEEITQIINMSDEIMPCMLAYHTTFNLPFSNKSSIENIKVKHNVSKEQVRDNNFYPTGQFAFTEREQSFCDGNFKPYGKAITALVGSCDTTTCFIDDSLNQSVKYYADNKFKYRMLWKGKESNFMVLEPQTCLIDCLNVLPNGDNGFISIPPHSSKQFKTKIYM